MRAGFADTSPLMPTTDADQPRRRGSTSSTRSRPSTPAATRPSAPSATRVEVSADVFRDGHEKLRAVVAARPAGAASGASPSCTPIDAHHNGVRWAGEFEVDDAGPLGVHDRGLDRRVRHLARRAAAQARGRPGRPGGRALRGRRAARAPRASAPRAADKRLIEHALAHPRRRARSSRRPSTTRRWAPSCSPRSSAARSATARPRSSRRWRSRSTACARASAPGTSSSRARGAA